MSKNEVSPNNILGGIIMINAKQARENSYNKTLRWCEEKLQPEIMRSIENGQSSVNRLFWEHSIDSRELKIVLEELGFVVEVEDITSQYHMKLGYGNIYNVKLSW